MSTRFDPPERGPLGPEVTTVVAAPIVPPASESAVSWGNLRWRRRRRRTFPHPVDPWRGPGAVVGVALVVRRRQQGNLRLVQHRLAHLHCIGRLRPRGYLAGRLRTKWTQIHGDETYFRDTAHGFVSWAVATLLTAGLLTSAIGGVLGGGKVAGATAGAAASTVGVAAAGASGAATAAPEGDLDYWVDSLFRSTTHAGPADPAAPPPGAPMDPNAAPPPAPGAGPRDARIARRRDRCRATVRSATAAKCAPK